MLLSMVLSNRDDALEAYLNRFRNTRNGLELQASRSFVQRGPFSVRYICQGAQIDTVSSIYIFPLGDSDPIAYVSVCRCLC